MASIGNLPWGKNNLASTFPNLGTLISLILRNALTLAGIILLALLIFGGLTFIIGAGNSDPKQAGQGKKAITSALVGFAIIFLAYSIIQVIQVITGLNILNPNL